MPLMLNKPIICCIYYANGREPEDPDILMKIKNGGLWICQNLDGLKTSGRRTRLIRYFALPSIQAPSYLSPSGKAEVEDR